MLFLGFFTRSVPAPPDTVPVSWTEEEERYHSSNQWGR